MVGKYYSKRLIVGGMKFDSVGEYERWNELMLLQRAGKIDKLTRQVEFELVPTQKADGKVVERAIKYIADFTYYENGKYVVEDFKGFKTKEYILKRKLMLYLKGIQIKEVK